MADNTILIKNAFILNPENPITGKKDLLIKNDLIQEIDEKIAEDNVDKIIDATDKILLPGFINDII